MSIFSFKDFLGSILDTAYTRQELLIKLQLDYDEFSGLDAITLSRWTNGVTQPSLYRQLLIASAVNCLDEYLNKCTSPPIPLVMEDHFVKYTNQFNSSYHLIWSPNYQENIRFKSGLARRFREFYKYSLKIDAISEVTDYLDKVESRHTVQIFYVGDEKNAESCIYFYDDIINIMKGLDLVQVADEQKIDLNNVILFGLAYFKCPLHCEVLLGLALNHIIRHYFNREKMFFVARGRTSMEFFEKINAKIFYSSPGNNSLGNMYIYYMDLQRVCGNPKFFSLIKKSHGLYEQLVLNHDYDSIPLTHYPD